MKILFCSPYLDSPNVVTGGIGIWARNILNYHHTLKSDVEVTPVSFDRRYTVCNKSTVLGRFFYGIRDYFRPIKETREHLKTGEYDVLHLCTSAQLSLYKDLCIMKMAKHYGAKAVVHFHFGRIPELSESKNWEYRILMKVCKAADGVTVMDQRSQDALLSLGLRNVYNLPNPLSMDIIQAVEGMEGKTNRIPGKLLFVGHVINSKGAIEMVEACKQFEGIELHVVGSGDDKTKNEMVRIASEKNNGEWLKFIGALPHDEVLQEMMSASVFVFPSHTEGFPNVILEAMACGCPIVTTSVGAIPEMLDIEHGYNYGICVKPRDTQAFADGLKQMLTNPENAARCAEKAKKRVNEMYAIPVVWNKLVKIWQEG